jgi:hypothetical protein
LLQGKGDGAVEKRPSEGEEGFAGEAERGEVGGFVGEVGEDLRHDIGREGELKPGRLSSSEGDKGERGNEQEKSGRPALPVPAQP